jgi:hypothetical protein
LAGWLRWMLTVVYDGMWRFSLSEAGYRDSAAETTVYTFGESNGLGVCLTAM